MRPSLDLNYEELNLIRVVLYKTSESVNNTGYESKYISATSNKIAKFLTSSTVTVKMSRQKSESKSK
jgi:hypothetical protein